ncbi:hypothetical protein D9756_006907 [Leucocoprinus leucothites]|uniref:Uncharacterized protein n=1 Tax=Leucocoprinus leucothites TaxID=201217 RepID=A0A8H5FZB5_9AGAR|nr:hypothetical protein D9756_006907 [Leucoagaricus leucothites]
MSFGRGALPELLSSLPRTMATPSSSAKMLHWKKLEHECLESADEVVNMVQKDDIVIFLWSLGTFSSKALLNLLAGTTHDLDWWKFFPQQTRHPTSGAQILLVSMLDIYSYCMIQKKQGFQRILGQMDKVGVKFGTHIWVHDISNPRLLTNGVPDGWDNLKNIFEGDAKLEMDNVTFLSVKWEKDSLEEGQEREQEIRKALESDVERGLAFGQLPVMDKDEAWYVIDGIINPTRDLLDGRAGKDDKSKELGMIADDIWERKRKRDEEARKKAEEERKRAKEDRRVGLLQRELRELYVELDKSEYGKGVQAKFRRADDVQKRIMEPLLALVDKEGLEPKEKDKLERLINEEYLLCLREFRGHFAEVRAMGIEVGYNLREFYGLREPKKKRFGLF